MPMLSPCLSSAELQEFLLGRIDEDRALEMESHLETCPECQHQMATQGTDDELVQALRQNSSVILPPEQTASELVDLLVPHFKKIKLALEETLRFAGAATDATDNDGSPTVTQSLTVVEEVAEHPRQLGRYEIRGVLGSGGMGTVLHAFDPLLNRSIAVKILQTGWLAEPGMAERMVAEAQAAAAVVHDNIVPIYSVELQHGAPCIVMPLLQGASLHRRLQDIDGPLPLNDILRMAREACQGLAAAHGAGLIHCDIKPANLWLEAPHDRVKILDFGLAIVHGKENPEDRGISGTPGYLAPEQAKGLPLDQRTDIFSLGCVFYYMATGQSAFTGERRLKALWTVLAEPPPAASEINPELPEEFSDLIECMMARDAADRPESVAVVLETLDAIEHRLAEIRGGIVRRRWLLAMFCVALFSAATVGAWAMFTAPRAARPVAVTLLGGPESLAIKLRRDGLETPVTLTGESVVSLPPGEYTTHLVADQPGRELLPQKFLVEENQPQVVSIVLVGEIARHAMHTRAVTGVAVQNVINPAGQTEPIGVWSVGLDRTLVFWDGTNSPGQLFATLPHEARCVAASPDGRHLATAGGNKQAPHELAIRVWNARSLVNDDTAFVGHERMVLAMAYSPDGQHLVSAGADGIFVWNLSGSESEVLPGSEAHAVHAIAFSRDGQQLISGGEDGTVAVWDMKTRALHRSYVVSEAVIRAVAFVPDGYLAAGDDGTVWTWKPSDEKPRALTVRSQPVRALAVSPSGDQLIIGDDEGTVAVWSFKSNQLSYEFRNHQGPVNTVAFVGDGRRAVSGGADRMVRLWRLPLP